MSAMKQNQALADKILTAALAAKFEKQRFNNTKLAKVNIGYINGKAITQSFPCACIKV